MVAEFCLHLPDDYVDLSNLYVDLSDNDFNLSDRFIDLSVIHVFKNSARKRVHSNSCHSVDDSLMTSRHRDRHVNIIILHVDIILC